MRVTTLLDVALRQINGAQAHRIVRPRRLVAPAATAIAAPLMEHLESRTLLSYTLNVLSSFALGGGSNPRAALVADSSGNLYGTAEQGGSYSDGTVFEIPQGSHTPTTLANFAGTNGAHPYAAVSIDAYGNLFGTTHDGGSHGAGTVFEISPGGGITSLASFNGVDGQFPEGSLAIDPSGDLFGTTYSGGNSEKGTIFEVANGSYAITSIASFKGSNGANPSGGLIFSAGNLIGTTCAGGAYGAGGDGTVFEVNPAVKNNIFVLASFDGSDGQDPCGKLSMDLQGNIYGAAGAGGLYGDGTVFKIANSSAYITALASFNGTDGASPQASVIVDSSGDLFGTTYLGGASSQGTAFEVAAGSMAITTLASFGGSSGEFPRADLYLDSNTNDLYGTAANGGSDGGGDVFELTYTPDSTVGGTVFKHSHKARKPPFANVIMDLQKIGHSGKLERAITVKTNSQGEFVFSGIAPAMYRLSESPPKGSRVTLPAIGYYTLDLTSPQQLENLNFYD